MGIKIKETSYNYIIIKYNFPELERESTLLPSKYLKSKKYAFIQKSVHNDGSESIAFIKYSNDINQLQIQAEGYVSWYNYPAGKAKDIQNNIFNI